MKMPNSVNVGRIAFVLLHTIVATLCEAKDAQSELFFKLTLPEGNHRIRLGRTVVLDCEAGGSPSPTMIWLHNGKIIKQGTELASNLKLDMELYENLSTDKKTQSLQLGTTRSRLYIDCMSPQDAGIYSCVAQTPLKKIVSTTSLRTDATIEYESSEPRACLFKKRGERAAIPARIYMWTPNRVEYVGADVRLFCRVDGKPIPQVHWFNPSGQRIFQNQKYMILSNGDLYIRRVNWQEDMGVYTCSVENSLGKDEVETFLYPTVP